MWGLGLLLGLFHKRSVAAAAPSPGYLTMDFTDSANSCLISTISAFA